MTKTSVRVSGAEPGRLYPGPNSKVPLMARPVNDDLTKPWKINMPATLAGKVEYTLLDPIHQKPMYGARTKLISALLEWWLAKQQGTLDAELPPIPSISELREANHA